MLCKHKCTQAACMLQAAPHRSGSSDVGHSTATAMQSITSGEFRPHRGVQFSSSLIPGSLGASNTIQWQWLGARKAAAEALGQGGRVVMGM